MLVKRLWLKFSYTIFSLWNILPKISVTVLTEILGICLGFFKEHLPILIDIIQLPSFAWFRVLPFNLIVLIWTSSTRENPKLLQLYLFWSFMKWVSKQKVVSNVQFMFAKYPNSSLAPFIVQKESLPQHCNKSQSVGRQH